MSKTMLINSIEGHECRIAVLDDNRLDELYTERASSVNAVGSIYKGKVVNIEPSIQAAFVEFGGAKNGFLHISDLHPKYFPKSKTKDESVGRRMAHHARPLIQDCLKRGKEVVVQMTKEGIGTKGPTLTTYLSLPGRMIVMMPDMSQVGISRKIEDDEARARLRKILDEVTIPENIGVIVRTAGADRTKRDLQRDIAYLQRLWSQIEIQQNKSKAPAELYQESDLVIRTLRDVYSSDMTRILCDDPEVGRRVMDFLSLSVPRHKASVELYRGKGGLFDEFGVEEAIQQIHSHRVELPGGGSLVIDQAEALVAIDINSGSFRKHKDPEMNTEALNLLAAEEIGRQLRLRDMGGVIVIDFVDMRESKHRRSVEKKLREVLKRDRAKSKVLKMSNFGLVEMTRQRLRPSLEQSVYQRCETCEGTGFTLSAESVALRALRDLAVATANEDALDITLTVAPSVAHHLLNQQRNLLTNLELASEKVITVIADPNCPNSDILITCINLRGSKVPWDAALKRARQTKESLSIDMRDVIAGKTDIVLSKAEPVEPILIEEEDEDEPKPAPKRSRRRSTKSSEKPATSEDGEKTDAKDEQESTEEKPKKRARRSRRGGRKKKSAAAVAAAAEAAAIETTAEDRPASEKLQADADVAQEAPATKESPVTEAPVEKETPTEPAESPVSTDSGNAEPAAESVETSEEAPPKAKKKRRRGRRGGRRRKSETTEESTPES
jgi:ribonuclease E